MTGNTKKENLVLLKEAYQDKNTKFTISYCRIGTKYPVEEFIESLGKAELTGLAGLMQFFAANNGNIKNDTKFKKLENHATVAVWELKKHQIRIAGFREGQNFNMFYAFKKKQDKWPKTNLNAMRKHLETFLKQRSN